MPSEYDRHPAPAPGGRPARVPEAPAGTVLRVEGIT
jgi:hypothetical protein